MNLQHTDLSIPEPEIHTSLPALVPEALTHVIVSGFYTGARDPNSGPHPCVASTLSPEPTAWPRSGLLASKIIYI